MTKDFLTLSSQIYENSIKKDREYHRLEKEAEEELFNVRKDSEVILLSVFFHKFRTVFHYPSLCNMRTKKWSSLQAGIF
jgi:hypothetical protein